MLVNYRLRHKITFAILVLFSSLTIQAETLQGKVVAIADGDTLTILKADDQQVKIRLASIDAPEKAQPFGKKSKQALSDLAFQQFVNVEVETIDRYGRTVGTIFIEDFNINASMIDKGLAWVYRKYNKDESLYLLEDDAKDNKRGLWADTDPIPPWEWRRGRRE